MDSCTILKEGENTPQLETERLILRKFTKDDTVAVLHIFRDKYANTFLPWFSLETKAQAQNFLQNRFLVYYQLPISYHYAICLKTDNIPIGYINISDNNSHDFGYGLKTEYWHKGIATEACRAVVDKVKLAGLPYITATHDVKNPRSGEVIKKIGMVYQYSYEEQWQPKNILVTFRMYQLNFDGQKDRIYNTYRNNNNHFVEKNI